MTTKENPSMDLDAPKFRLPIRRCRRCQSWLGVIAAHEHECHRDDTVIDAILIEYAAALAEGAPR